MLCYGPVLGENLCLVREAALAHLPQTNCFEKHFATVPDGGRKERTNNMENIISMGTLGRPVGAQTTCPEDIQDIRLGDTVPGKELSFVLVNGVLVANNSVMLDVPFEVLRASHLVRARAVVIDGSAYQCRLLQTDGSTCKDRMLWAGNDEDEADEWDWALIATGSNRSLWNLYDNEPFWTLSLHGREIRGGHGSSEGRYAWRPVLEPVSLAFSRLRKDGMIIAGGGNSLFRTRLHDVSDYDLILDMDSDANMAPDDAFADISDDGYFVLDRSALVVARMAPEQEAPHG